MDTIRNCSLVPVFPMRGYGRSCGDQQQHVEKVEVLSVKLQEEIEKKNIH